MHTVEGGLPSLTFDAESIPLEFQFEVFRDTTAPLFDARPLRSAGETAPTRATAQDYFIDGLVVSRLICGQQILHRTPRHTNVAGDCLSVLLPSRGGLWGSISHRSTLDLDSLHVAILDFAQPFDCWSDDSDLIWIMIPRARLGPIQWPSGVPIARFHRQSVRGRVLVSAVEHIWAEADDAPSSRGPALAASVVEAVRAVLRPGDFVPHDSSLRLAMKDYIAAHLDDLGLDHRSLSAAFYCSRSALYRLFQDDGGVVAYIREQRLLRCFEELTRAPAGAASVSGVATQWGFENASHFNRLFKTAFGLPPSAVIERMPAGIRDPHASIASDQVIRFHDWTAAL